MEISVVVPVYNSAEVLPTLVERLEATTRDLTLGLELILVNDGSRDESWETIQSLAKERPWIRGINLMRNFGQHNALLCGIRAASRPLLVTMDDDLQHPPEEMWRLIEELDRGFDVVYGSAKHQQHEPLRVLASRLSKLALKRAMGVGVAPHVSAFRAFRTNLREAFSGYSGSFVSIDVLLTWATTRFSAVEVRHDPRFKGRSQYTLRKLATHGLNMMTGFSVLPLQVASVLGLTFTLFGLGVQTYVLGRWLIHGSVVPGFAFLASIITIFSGAQLFALGIIGEYLARMHSRLMDRPPYVIDSQLPSRREGNS